MSTAVACPGCAAAPLAMDQAAKGVGDIVLSLPTIHCAACISKIENVLLAADGVRAARVNLSRKRVSIDAPHVDPDTLIALINAEGFEALPLDAAMMASVETDKAGKGLLLRIAVAGFAMMNVMLFSVAVWSGAAEATRTMFHWLSAIIAVPALVFSAEVFFREAWKALRVWRVNMDVPISLAIILAAGLSVYETAMGSGHVYFDAALSLTFFLLIGRYLDHRTRIAARSAAQELAALVKPTVARIVGDRVEIINVSELNVGDHIRVAAGMRLPVDGVIVSGRGRIDRSVLTGESRPIDLACGDLVSAGEINLESQLTVEATAVGQDTSLAQIVAMVETAESAKNTYTALADRAAQIYAPAVHLTALITFVGWIIVSGDFPHALRIAISVLIITCPCALGLAVPAVMTAATGRLFRRGLLIKNGTALERMAEVDTVVFDKTGTLTVGHATIDTESFDDLSLGVLAGLARASDHPVSQSIAAAISADVRSSQIENITETAGLGIAGTYQGQAVFLGRDGDDGDTVLRIAGRDKQTIPMKEALRDGAKEAVAYFADQGRQVIIMSGDNAPAVSKIATALGVGQAHANMRPQDKQEALIALHDSGAKVLMVGDGLNDTLALAQSYVSISPATALDASRTASDIVLLGSNLGGIPDVIETAKSAKARVIENFAIAAGYNMIAIPIAVLGFATPLGAAIAMSASSITVLLNALRVR